MYKIVHDKENCIGCGACVALDEENWEMDEDKVKFIGVKEFSELKKHKEIAEACPVNVIHIFKGERKII